MDFCHKHDIHVTVYGGQLPLTRGWLEEAGEASTTTTSAEGAAPVDISAVNPPVLVDRAVHPVWKAVRAAMESHEKTAGQILLRWAYQTGRMPITTSGKPSRMREYLDVFPRSSQFVLTKEEVMAISVAGRDHVAQRRGFWAKCADFFAKDPGLERESRSDLQE